MARKGGPAANQSTFVVTGNMRVQVTITRTELAEALATEVRRALGIGKDVHDLVTQGGAVIHRPSSTRWENPNAAALVDAMNVLQYGELRTVSAEAAAEDSAGVEEEARAPRQESLTDG